MTRNLVLLTVIACANACTVNTTEPTKPELEVQAATQPLTNPEAGAVFTESNEADGNRVFAFSRDSTGELATPVTYATGGNGSGAALGSQSAVTLTGDHRFLLVVNAGSNDVSSFAVNGSKLELRDRVPSGGVLPISVDEGRGLVYVLNAGGTNNVSGFFLDLTGHLHPLPHATQPLSAASVGPAQVALDPLTLRLIVTEKNTNKIDVYRVGVFGGLSAADVQASAGQEPFGFDISVSEDLIVSEAATGSLSSYRFRIDTLVPISSVVPDTQVAPCWVAISPDGRHAYTANAHSGSISSYTVARGGVIALQDARAGELGAGGTPLDLAFAAAGNFLYVVDSGHVRVMGFAAHADGSLDPLSATDELTPFVGGLAAY